MEHGDSPTVQRLVLVGFMGCGKSTVGRVLARRLGWTFLDVDDLLVEREGRSIERIFDEDGEAGFRRIEHEVTLEQLARDRVVVATGGGWPVMPGRMETVGPGSLTVWLDVPLSELESRLSGPPDERPLLNVPDRQHRMAELLSDRMSWYQQAAARVDGRGLPEAVAERILALMGS
jgi:shikimate kinase